MNIKNLNTCINCENLLADFICQKHKLEVKITNYCESHTFKSTINKNSSCSNCFHFSKTSCTKPQEASSKMVCFDWEEK